MPVPKRKTSKSRRDQRSANKGITPQIVSACKECEYPQLPHQACSNCGFYKGVKVLKTKNDRTVTRAETRAAHEAKKAKTTPSESAQ
jgi:large subunit ribosomal protein L32